MVDDGYLVGYEDGSGNFVEVGRFNNTSENVSDPLIIQHSDSGQKMELGPNGFSTDSVSTDQLTGGLEWFEVSDNRSLNNTETNNFGNDIYVKVTVQADQDGTDTQYRLNVDGTQRDEVRDRSMDSEEKHTLSAKVPLGSTYEMDVEDVAGSSSLFGWNELR